MKCMKFMGVAVLVALLAFVAVPSQAGDINVTPANASWLDLPPVATSVTNGQAYTLSNTLNRLTATGAASNDVTFAAATDDGVIVVIENVGTNLLCVADSGTANLTAQFNMGQGDTLTLISNTNTAKWTEKSRANN